jgi:hypothetical protein
VNEPPKLPQARMYLQSAQWGFDELLTSLDLEKAVRRAIDWCDRELTAIEAKLPPAPHPAPL